MPSRKHPEGRSVAWAQDVMLEGKKGLPYTISGEPMIGIRFFKYNIIPERFWAIGLVEPGIGPQRQRNRSRSQYIEIKDRAGLGRIYTRPNALNVNTLAGGKVVEVIEVRPGAEIPTETNGLGPGPWMAEDIAMHDNDIDKVMGMGQVTLGQGAPGGVSAYSAMALLAEQDDRRVGPIIRHIRNNVTWLTKFTLQDVRRYWGPQKQIQLAGEDDKIQAFIFNAAQLPDEIYVKVGRGARRRATRPLRSRRSSISTTAPSRAGSRCRWRGCTRAWSRASRSRSRTRRSRSSRRRRNWRTC